MTDDEIIERARSILSRREREARKGELAKAIAVIQDRIAMPSRHLQVSLDVADERGYVLAGERVVGFLGGAQADDLIAIMLNHADTQP